MAGRQFLFEIGRLHEWLAYSSNFVRSAGRFRQVTAVTSLIYEDVPLVLFPCLALESM